MGYLKDFNIPFSGLSLGSHEFAFVADNKFFEEIEYSEIKKGSVGIRLTMEKQETMLMLEFDLDGTVKVDCDRCLDELEMSIKTQFKLIVKFGQEFSEESDEIITIPESHYQINVGTFIYEYISVSLPIQRIHSDDKDGYSMCNPEVLDLLNQPNEPSENDPRWEALKKLKDKL